MSYIFLCLFVLDPRLWNKQDVHSWLAEITLRDNIDIDISRFNMNGKALCLMSVEMFVKRVPVGGKLLYRDFRTRLHTAVYLEDTMVRTLRRIHPSTIILDNEARRLQQSHTVTLTLHQSPYIFEHSVIS